MYIKSKKVTLYWKLNPSLYKTANMEELSLLPERLGSTGSATSAMLENTDELRTIMRSVIDLNPNSPEWDTKVKYWFDSFDIAVPGGQKDFEVGFRYNINDVDRKANIEKLLLTVKSIKNDRDLAEYVNGTNSKGVDNVPENQKYLYAAPINPKEYIQWRYALVNKFVANNISDVNNSPNIIFYLYDEDSRKIRDRKILKSTTEAMKVYLEIEKDADTLDNVLSIMSKTNITGLSKDDKLQLLKGIYDTEPDKLVTTFKDKHITIKAEIERMIKAGILTRYANSSVIVSSSDSTDVIGENMDAAISYFNVAKNKTKVDRFKNMMAASKGKTKV